MGKSVGTCSGFACGQKAARSARDARDIRSHERVVALILEIEHTPLHHCVETAQRGNQQMQSAGADRRPVGGLDEPAFDAIGSEHAASLQQEQPRVHAAVLASGRAFH